MIWLVAWIDFSMLLFAAILTPVRRPSATVIDLSEQRRRRQGRRVRS